MQPRWPAVLGVAVLALFIAFGVDARTTTPLVAGKAQDVGVGSGQTVFIKRGIVHGFRNDTQEPATCLCVLSPGVLGPAYFRELAALIASGAPDLAKMKEIMLRYGLVPVPPS